MIEKLCVMRTHVKALRFLDHLMLIYTTYFGTSFKIPHRKKTNKLLQCFWLDCFLQSEHGSKRDVNETKVKKKKLQILLTTAGRASAFSGFGLI